MSALCFRIQTIDVMKERNIDGVNGSVYIFTRLSAILCPVLSSVLCTGASALENHSYARARKLTDHVGNEREREGVRE